MELKLYMHKWMDWIDIRMGRLTNGCQHEWMDEWPDERVNAHLIEWIDGWTGREMIKYIEERLSNWMNGSIKRMNECIDEWIN